MGPVKSPPKKEKRVFTPIPFLSFFSLSLLHPLTILHSSIPTGSVEHRVGQGWVRGGGERFSEGLGWTGGGGGARGWGVELGGRYQSAASGHSRYRSRAVNRRERLGGGGDKPPERLKSGRRGGQRETLWREKTRQNITIDFGELWSPG